jgi:hypothetical protein
LSQGAAGLEAQLQEEVRALIAENLALRETAEPLQARVAQLERLAAALQDQLAAVMAAGAIALQPLVAATATLPEATALAAMAWRSAAWLFAAATAVAACRWFVARRRFERQIRMTPEEFADESKSAQADPKVRLLQRQRPRQPAAGAA